MHGQFITSKYGWIDKLETYNVVILSWNFISWSLVPEIIIIWGTLPGTTALSSTLRPPFRGGRQNRGGMGRSVRGADSPKFTRGHCWGFNLDGFYRTPNCKLIQKCSECGAEHLSVSKQPAGKPNFGTKVTTTK